MHFIAGFPRSGSTLLAALLRQNPRFEASIQSPLGQTVDAILSSFSGQNEAAVFYNDDLRVRILRGLFSAYYTDYPDCVFDTNRRWCVHAGLLKELYPDSKIICCVRPVGHVVDSVERFVQRTSCAPSAIFGFTANMTVYQRVHKLMQGDGLVGYALNAFRQFYYGPYRDMMIKVEYADLARFPADTLEMIHRELNEPSFQYDFKNVQQIPGADAFDQSIYAPGLHDVKPEVLYSPRNSILPPDIYKSMPQPFWRLVNTPSTNGD